MKYDKQRLSFDAKAVFDFLPHRYPFLFVDRIESVDLVFNDKGDLKEVGTSSVGIKAVTVNEPYFVGHFPGQPITPGVILIETMAQVASFCLYPWVAGPGNENVRYEMRLAGVDSARFRKPAVPGDLLRIKTEVIKYRKPLWGFGCEITSAIDNSAVAECQFLASIDIFQK